MLFREGRLGVFARAGLDRAVVVVAAVFPGPGVYTGLNVALLIGDLPGAGFNSVIHGRLLRLVREKPVERASVPAHCAFG
jgi:hypothetical protein